MKHIRFVIFALASVLTASCCNKEVKPSDPAEAMAILKDPSSKKVLVASHRGDWRNYPENSIPAIESIIRMGVDIMELDVAMTSDSVLVLSHDATVNRMTNGKGPVSSFTLDSLKTLKLKRAHGVTTDSLRVPTLEEALKVCKDRILVNVDHGWNYFDQVMEVAQKVGCVDQIIFKSGGTRQATAKAMQQCKDAGIFYMPIVTVVRDGSSPTLDTYLDGGEMPAMFEVCFTQDIPQVAAYTKAIQDAGSKVWINSIWGSLCGYNDDDRAFQSPEEAEKAYGRLIELGAKVFQTDRPEYLLQYLRKHNLHD
ncbi:MAG: glycerophosphodiester phosphodiesterase family protein [Bacteroidales bacterium]|nr:glycerophosphodiester phosphodiesterase family protein [Bacteroidales bacterium]